MAITIILKFCIGRAFKLVILTLLIAADVWRWRCLMKSDFFEFSFFSDSGKKLALFKNKWSSLVMRIVWMWNAFARHWPHLFKKIFLKINLRLRELQFKHFSSFFESACMNVNELTFLIKNTRGNGIICRRRHITHTTTHQVGIDKSFSCT